MNEIEVGHSTDELSFRQGLARLGFAINKLSDIEIATAIKTACESARIRTLKRNKEEEDLDDDTGYFTMLMSLSPTARVVSELIEALMDIGA